METSARRPDFVPLPTRLTSFHAHAHRGQAHGGALTVQKMHIDAALKVVLPSVSRRDEARYKALALKIRQSRAHVKEEDGEAPTQAPPAMA
jgi:hypothetical protein